jgi:alanine racemase
MNTNRGGQRLRTWIEIDRRAIAHNYRLVRSLIPKSTKLAAVVKSNAYGHYLVDFARELERLGADYLAVDSIVEGIRLRKSGVRAPLLVLAYTLPENLTEAAKRKIDVAVSSFVQLERIRKKRFPAPLSLHIKTDTGMHRQGFLPEDIPRVMKILGALSKRKDIRIAGLFTHFAGAKGKRNALYTRKQVREFRKWIAAFSKGGFAPLIHAAASGGTLLFPEAHYGMVRPGIVLYGIWPSDEAEKKLKRKLALAPVLSWKSIISETKRLPKGSKIGYDGTETLKRLSTVAICPVGYWHGFPRALSSKGHVLVRGKRAKVLGRVSMDMIAIDVTGIPGVRSGDVVTLIGKDGALRLRAEDIAKLIPGSSAYELLTRLNPLIKRIFV